MNPLDFPEICIMFSLIIRPPPEHKTAKSRIENLNAIISYVMFVAILLAVALCIEVISSQFTIRSNCIGNNFVYMPVALLCISMYRRRISYTNS